MPRLRSRSLPLLAVVLATATTGSSGPDLASQSVGVIVGTVSLSPTPSRRTANRYPGGAAEVHAIQQLPAVAYLVGSASAPAAGSANRATMEQSDTAFAPSVVAVPAGGVVSFPNGDPFFHNVFSYSTAQRFDLGRYPQGESKDVSFPEPGIVEVFCEVHEFMRGAILVTENPHHALVATDGSFRITGVPAGEHTIAFWHPDHEPLERRVTVTDGGTARIEVELTR